MLEGERHALVAHRAALRGATLPPAKDAPIGTFVHGFLLPFSLAALTLRDPELRRPYLRVALVRALVVLGVTVIALASGKITGNTRGEGFRVNRSIGPEGRPNEPVHVSLPGVHVDIDDAKHKAEVSILGKNIPGLEAPKDAPPTPSAPPTPPPPHPARALTAARAGWGWVLALLAFVSAAEGVVVFLSRRWDDALSFHASRLAGIRPEDDAPKKGAIALDLKWLYRKMRRRLRGYVVFFAGFPALLALRLVPTAGPWLFSFAALVWGWYWLGVFAASKSAHAWGDDATASPPAPIRVLERTAARGWVWAPLRTYARIWARVTRSINPAVATFERSPKPFLGLALARGILSLPGLYLLARPIVPVAAGRLCAEADPAGRFLPPPVT